MNPTPATPPPAADPFAIGWRDVRRTQPDGSVVIDQIPLTLEDALHPQEGDVIVMNSAHNRDFRYLQDVFEQRVRGDAHALVLGDCKVLWEDGVHHSPDISVIRGVREVRDTYSQFEVAEEGVRPALVIEIVSPTTRDNDIVTKVRHYHRYRVPQYVIVDREDEGLPTLIGYQYSTRSYVRTAADEEGRLWLNTLGLLIGVSGNRVVVYDGETEKELGDYSAIAAALEEAEQRATTAEQRAESAENRAMDEALRAGEAVRRADAEARRADEIQRQAAEEKSQAAARIRELEDQLRRAQPPTP